MQIARKTRALKSGKGDFAVARLLGKIVKGKALLNLLKGATLFRQGEEADAIYFIQKGKVRLSVVSKQGKKAILGVIGPRDFLGEECLVGDSRRTSTATCRNHQRYSRFRSGPCCRRFICSPSFPKSSWLLC